MYFKIICSLDFQLLWLQKIYFFHRNRHFTTIFFWTLKDNIFHKKTTYNTCFLILMRFFHISFFVIKGSWFRLTLFFFNRVCLSSNNFKRIPKILNWFFLRNSIYKYFHSLWRWFHFQVKLMFKLRKPISKLPVL